MYAYFLAGPGLPADRQGDSPLRGRGAFPDCDPGLDSPFESLSLQTTLFSITYYAVRRGKYGGPRGIRTPDLLRDRETC